MTKLFLQKKDVAAMVGRNIRTIDRWISEGFFPKGRYIKGSPTWTQKDIDRWYKTAPADAIKRLPI